jgi:hypothetical protein
MRAWFVAGALGLGVAWPGRSLAQAPPPPGKVGVFIQAYDEGVVLEEEQETFDARGRSRGLRFLPTCTAPCRLDLDVSKTYRITGPDITPSPPFQLPQGAASVAIQVNEGHVSDRTTGALLRILGAALILGGSVWFIKASYAEGGPDNTARLYAGGLFLAGVGAAVPGILLTRSGRTSINLVPGPSAAISPTALGSSLRCEF